MFDGISVHDSHEEVLKQATDKQTMAGFTTRNTPYEWGMIFDSKKERYPPLERGGTVQYHPRLGAPQT